MSNTTDKLITPLNWILMVFVAIIVPSFLLYLDKGLSNFHWMEDPEAWAMFLIFSALILFIELIIFHILIALNRLF